MCASKEFAITPRRHHGKGKFCHNRPAYREARWERAVKVYTINQESQYVLIQGVPAVGAEEELIKLCALYGNVEQYQVLHDYPAEEFTEVYLIKYQKVQSARFAKKKLDNRSFFGGILHVAYAPEFETVVETRRKLYERKRTVEAKIKEFYRPESGARSGETLNKYNDSRADVCTEKGNVDSATQLPQQNLTTSQLPNNPQNSAFPPPVLPYHQFPPPPPPPPYMLPPRLTVPTGSSYGPPLPQYLPPYMPLPPPPAHLPPVMWTSAASSSDESSHKIPTKNATLPKYVQDAEDKSALLRAGMKRTIDSRKICGDTIHNVSTTTEISTSAASGVSKNDLHAEKSKPRIVWKQSGQTGHSNREFGMLYHREPTAWDPFREERKKANSVTGSSSLDQSTEEIRKKMSMHKESSRSILTDLYDVEETIPVKVRKKTDRKRI